jgi:hypothetical protein
MANKTIPDLTVLASFSLADQLEVADASAADASVRATGTVIRAGLGLDPTSSPQFTAVNIGHASDTTLARSAAGKVAVEGKAVPLMSGAFDAVFAGPTAARTYTLPDANATLLYSGGAGGTPSSIVLTNATAYPTAVKVTSGNYTVGTTSAQELWGGAIYVTGAATITIPAVAAGQSFTVVTIGAVAVSVDPNASDLIYLDGTALSDGDKITNLSTAGDIAVFTYYDATGWSASTNGWTDGN